MMAKAHLLGLAFTLAGSLAQSKPTGEMPRVRYTLSMAQPVQGQEGPRIEMKIETAGTADGTTTFELPEESAGNRNLERGIHGLAIHDGAGKRLDVRQGRAHEWTVDHPPGAALVVTYGFGKPKAEIDTKSEDYYRPVVQRELVHLLGSSAFLRPRHAAAAPACKVQLRWSGFQEAGWKTVSSFSADPKGCDVELPLAEFLDSVFFAGELRIHRMEIEKRELVVAMAGQQWKFTDEAFVDLARRVVKAERDLMRDHTVPYFLITLLPVGKHDPESRSRSLGGTGLTHSFALFVTTNVSLEIEPGPGMSMAHLLAHELFHYWNGRVLGRVEPEQLVYWFSEGFTEFFARRALARAGIYSLDNALENLNQSLAQYALSAERNAPNTRILEAFWSSREVQSLPYRRGDLVATALDREIRVRSGGKKCLDHFFLDLMERAKAGGAKASVDSLLADMERWTSPEFAVKMRAVLERGETLELPADAFGPFATIEPSELPQFEAGFDADETRKRREVVGVVEGSAAWKAGLRDGQKLRGFAMANGDVSFPVELTIQEGTDLKKISYLPHGKGVRGQRAVRRADADAAAFMNW
ncbi:MAG: hypothetical protein JNJ88_15630 [Planctomycetes bacterium]|nr:hypothetical protein [Planctomycetota bacterium]